jgi:hypothetical protein
MNQMIYVGGFSKFNKKVNTIIFFPEDMDNAHTQIKMKKIFDVLN